MPSGVDILAGAKKALESANKFTQSVEGQAPSSSHADYPVARAVRKSGGLSDEARSAGEGIKARMENEAAAKKSIE